VATVLPMDKSTRRVDRVGQWDDPSVARTRRTSVSMGSLLVAIA
jgi:hypothetical protein